ncbi:MAG: hypothetical protein KDA57_22770, partial [Planctomycetales bacterium]|nr:hypothetical protein [Planctomycetales bacterium]
MDFQPSPRSAELTQRVRDFIRQRIKPVEADYWHAVREAAPDGDWSNWQVPSVIEELKAAARAEG